MKTYKSIPRIGRQEFLRGLNLLVQMVGLKNEVTESNLREFMKQENDVSETQPFKDIEEWLKFSFDDRNTSIEILHRDDDGIVTLTEDGKKLLDAERFEQEAFRLLVRKSRTNFTYFHKTIKALDDKVQSGKYGLGPDLDAEVNTLMVEGGSNTITAGTISGILKSFDLVDKVDDEYQIDPAVYTNLRDDDATLIKEIIREEESEMPYATLEDRVVVKFQWELSRLEGVISDLETQNKVRVYNRGGRKYIQLLT